MKKTLLVSFSLMLCLALVVSVASAKYVGSDKGKKVFTKDTGSLISLDQDVSQYFSSAAQATTILATYDFDNPPNCDFQGWTSHDITAQVDDFFHVADATELNGGTFGRLNVLAGLQSLYGGAVPSVPLCGYLALPGYGNNWNQAFCTKECQTVASGVTVTFRISWDSEPGYDATALEVTTCTGPVSDENWVPFDGGIGVFDGNFQDSLYVATVPDSLHSGSVKIRFHFTADGAWSDEDALWDTDGFAIIDNLIIDDSGGNVLPLEDFEGEAPGSKSTNDWESCTPAGYGDFAGLFQATTVVLEDPCLSNVSCLVAYYAGSTINYACGGFPAQTAMPKKNNLNQYLNNEIWSGPIPWVGAGGVGQLVFDSYRDLPLDNLQFYVWHVRSYVAGCPGGWQDRNFVYFGGQKDWLRTTQGFGDLVEPGATDIEIALGAVDMCIVWCGVFGTGNCHSHAPLHDNVEVRRIDTGGPQWSIRDIDLFQDTFPGDGTITGTGRADGAIDILPSANPNFLPGDSTSVVVNDPVNGLAGDPFTGFGAAVYAYVAVWPPGRVGGPQLTQDTFRHPLVDSLIHDGVKWYCLRMDTSFTDGTTRTGPQPDKFAIDLNDNLFIPCDTICFVFCAESAVSGDRSYWTPFTGTTPDLWLALDNPAEFQILPGAGWKRGGDILYVDGMNARGAQPFFDSAFDYLAIRDLIDRYDIRGPSSSVANRPGARVVDVFQQILFCYRKIIWNTGDLSAGTIGDGTGNPEKSDDAFLLFTFLDNLASTGGVYINGDDVASELAGLGGAFVAPLLSYINYTVVSTNANITSGLGLTPWGIGTVGNCFDHITGPDTLVVYGGCALINDFDVITPTGPATQEMNYVEQPQSGSDANGAVVGQVTLNTAGFNVGVLMSGFSFHYIRDDRVQPVPDRVHHMRDILVWLNNTPIVPVGGIPSVDTYSLSQNYPNPFNPQTTIQFTVKERTNVSLKIYNVAGQLVRTLVNDVKTPGITHTIEWNGRNNAGSSVSSGVYFYKLVAKDFAQTKKMVLLK